MVESCKVCWMCFCVWNLWNFALFLFFTSFPLCYSLTEFLSGSKCTTEVDSQGLKKMNRWTCEKYEKVESRIFKLKKSNSNRTARHKRLKGGMPAKDMDFYTGCIKSVSWVENRLTVTTAVVELSNMQISVCRCLAVIGGFRGWTIRIG